MPKVVRLNRSDGAGTWRVVVEKIEAWGPGSHLEAPGFVEYAGRQIPVEEPPEELDRLLEEDSPAPIAEAARGLVA